MNEKIKKRLLYGNLILVIILSFLVFQKLPLRNYDDSSSFSFNFLTGNVPREINSPDDVGLSIEIVQKINNYDALILQYCRDESKENSQECVFLTKSIISAESFADENYIAPYSRVGLMGITKSLALSERYSSIFNNKITDCCTNQGSIVNDCSQNPGCNIDNDNRFDPARNLQAGIRNLMTYYNQYNGNIYMITLAYFTNKDIADFALIKISKRASRDITKDRVLDASKSKIIELSKKLKDELNFKELFYYDEFEKYITNFENYYSFWSHKPVGEQPSFQDMINSFGLYMINPSFSINLNYDLSEYEDIKNDIHDLVDKCNGAFDLENCIKNKISSYGTEIADPSLGIGSVEVQKYKWNLDSCEQEYDFFDQFIEDIYLCKNSNLRYNDCVCNLRLSSLPTNYYIEMTKLGTSIKIDLKKISNSGSDRTIVRTDEVVMSYNMPSTRLCYFDEKTAFVNFFGSEDSFEYDVDKVTLNSLSENKITLKESSSRILSNKMFKHDSNMICFIPQDSLSTGNIDETIGSCNSEKKFYKFCVESNEQKLFSKTINTKEDTSLSEIKPVQYKFALYFKDDPPEKINSLEIIDAPKNRDSLYILFSKSNAEDISKYNLYYQNMLEFDELKENVGSDSIILEDLNELNDMNVMDMKEEKNAVIYLTLNPSVAETITQSPVDFDCIFDYDKRRCKFNVMNEWHTLSPKLFDFQKDKLYFLKDKNQYLYVLSNLEKNVNYKIGITAVDKKGNELTNSLEEGITIKDVSNSVLKDDLYFWRISRSYANIGWSGYAFNLNSAPTEFENKDTTEEVPDSYSLFYYITDNSLENCEESSIDNIYLYKDDLKLIDFPINVVGLPSMSPDVYYCFGILAERENKRNLLDEVDYDSVKNLVSFAYTPNKVEIFS